MFQNFYLSNFYQIFLHGLFSSFGGTISDPSFGRRDLTCHPIEAKLRELKEYWWVEEYLKVYPNEGLKRPNYPKHKLYKDVYLQSWCLKSYIFNPQAEIIMLHGIAAYGGYLAKLIPYYCSQGYRVHILDLPSHGRSDGISVDITDIQILIDALHSVILRVKSYGTKCPLFILGYSLGGLIAIKYSLLHPQNVSGLSLVSPCIKLSPSIVNNSALINLGKVVAKLTPRLTLPASDNGKDKEKHHSRANSDENLELDLENDFVKDDPLMAQQSARVGTLIMILNATTKLPDELSKLQVPFFVQQGGKDSVLDPSGANLLIKKSGSIDKLSRIYPHLEHSMFCSNLVINDSIDWIKSQVERLAPPIDLTKA